MLAGARVLDLSTGIAGGYCTKLLADAGADVVKVEPEAGDPLRRYTAAGGDLGGADGALFRFLNTSKRSSVAALDSAEARSQLAAAHVVVESGRLSDRDLQHLRSEHPAVSVVSVTPFGRTGPAADRASTEFTLQALCGSTASRGLADAEPLHAGGRLGEWTAGVYAAVAAVAVLHGRNRTGGGEHVDVSMLECMSITMGGYASLRQSFGGPTPSGPARTVELPSIEPTADGYVGFCTITRQQFDDFLLLIERSDLLGDDDLAGFVGRQRRRREFATAVHDWTTKRRTADIVEHASLLRIPVAPIGTPETVAGIDQFVERGVFVDHPGGDFRQPRVPYRVDGRRAAPFGPAPRLGEHTGTIGWPDDADRDGDIAVDATAPLAGVRVVDLTAFWAGPAATQVLAALGADVIKVESVQRPDGMRFTSSKPASEPDWWEWSSQFHAVNVNKRAVTLDLASERGRGLLHELLRISDVLIENFSPRVLDGFGLDRPFLAELNPRLVTVRMPAFGLDGPWRDRTGFAQTMEQAAGMAWMTGFADGPPVIPRGPCDPIAGMHAAFAVIAALDERERSGRGHFIESTMVEAALNVAAEIAIEHSAYGGTLIRQGNRGPDAAPQGLYPCRGDERWLAVAVADDEQWRALRQALGDPPWASAPELAAAAGRRRCQDDIDRHLRAWAAERELADAVGALSSAGVPAAPVVAPHEVIADEQLRARGFVEAFDHPVVGRHEVIGVPFRFASRSTGWIARPAPTLGQHNDEVLGGLLGLSAAELDDLRAQAVIGDRPAGA
jgi:crotonobetainyl-CoA:carnitine CoA-transferase CaiB-like acyl-CoA transferase